MPADEHDPNGKRSTTSAALKAPLRPDENEGRTVDVEHPSPASDVTLRDTEERDGSNCSRWVKIEDTSTVRKCKGMYVTDAGVGRPTDFKHAPSVHHSQHRGIMHFLMAPLSCCSTSSSNTTVSGRRALPWKLYDDVHPSSVELHLFPSPFHPKPLVPLLCVADERNIIPIVCSTLHQRRALGRDAPVVGILLPKSGSTCEVLFAWMEQEPRPGRTLVRSYLEPSP